MNKEIPALIRKNLEPLMPYLEKRNLVEICINQPGEAWVETSTNGWKRYRDPSLDLGTLNALANVLAQYSGQNFSREIPTVATHLPGYGYRCNILGEGVAATKFAMSIRAGAAQVRSLTDWFDQESADYLADAFTNGATVLVAGSTGSGKTTFANSLVHLVDRSARIVTIEDTQELQLPHENWVPLIKSKSGSDVAGVTYGELVNQTLRMRPDRVFFGELDVANVVPFLRMSNTGHKGGISTFHADSPDGVLEGLVQNALLSGLDADGEVVRRWTLQALDIIVHLERVSWQEFKAVYRTADQLAQGSAA